jgi:hypothetical protein
MSHPFTNTRRVIVTTLIVMTVAAIAAGSLRLFDPASSSAATGSTQTATFAGLATMKAPVPADVGELLREGGMGDQAITYRVPTEAGMSVFVAQQGDTDFLVIYNESSRHATMTKAPVDDIAKHGLLVASGTEGTPGVSFAALVPDGASQAATDGATPSRVAISHNVMYARQAPPFTAQVTIAGQVVSAVVKDDK